MAEHKSRETGQVGEVASTGGVDKATEPGAARGAVSHLAQDIVHGVREIGGELTSVVRDGATGLVGVVGEVGSSTVHALTGVLVDVVDGVRQIAGAATGGNSGAARRAAQAEAKEDKLAPGGAPPRQEQDSTTAANM